MIIQLKKSISFTGYSFLCTLACFLVLWGCATVPRETNIIASVDGETIIIKDLIYSLDISHRVENLSSAGKLDISGFIQKLVDELLIVQEARRMGMEDYPEIRKKVDAYVLRESVLRLYKDEILEKAHVSEAKIRERFRHDYERFTLGIITTTSLEDAADILERLKAGEDFGELAREHSVDYSKDGGEKTLKMREMVLALKKAVLDLSDGEISDVIAIREKFFYIVKLIERQDAAEDEYEEAAKGIEMELSKLEIKKRSDEYLAELRARMGVEIDRELLMSLELDNNEGRKQSLKDTRVLVKINNIVLTAGEFAARLAPSQVNSREKALNSWVDIQVVNNEALSRQYELRPSLEGKLRRYKRQVLKDLFVNKVIVPRISITREEMEDYYNEHKDDFVKPRRYKIQQVTVKTLKDARNVLNSLNDGASFSWLAKRRSTDSFASRGGAAGWKVKSELSEPAAKMIDTLQPGEISPILEVKDHFRVIRLQEKSEPDFKEFDEVRKIIHRRMFGEKYKEKYNEYLDKLKEDSQIEIYEEVYESYKASVK
jgi:parvulin-like peptidyl-prolyl isomerase